MMGILGAFHTLFLSASLAALPSIYVNQTQFSILPEGQTGIALGTRFDAQLSDYVGGTGDAGVVNRIEAEFATRSTTLGFMTGVMDAGAMVGSTRARSVFYPLVRDFYVSFANPNLAPAVQVSIGAKRFLWSTMDRHWNLGIWEPRYLWDAMAPDRRGLTGIHIESKVQGFRLYGFLSPIHIPEKNSYFDEGQLDPKSPDYTGRCISHSPTFACPPASIPVGEVSYPVRYSLELPPLNRVILNPSVGLAARVGEDRGFWAQVSYAYKPINQIILSYDPFATLDVEAKVQIYPRILYHEMRALEAGWTGDRVKVFGSVTGERPIREATDPDKTAQTLTTALFASAGVAVAPLPETQALTLHASVLRIIGGESVLVGPKASQLGGSSEPRLLFSSAVSVGAKGQLSERFGYATYFLYDYRYDGNLLSTSLNFQASRQWTLLAGAEFLGVGSKAVDRAREDFFTIHAAQDRVYGGVRYVF